MKVAFAGDIFLGGDLLEEREPDKSPLRCAAWEAADVRVLNLEHPVSDRPSRPGDRLLNAPSAALSTLKALRVDAVGVANNHIFDRGADGLGETRGFLEAAGISATGAGQDLDEARKPLWLTDRLCLHAYCDFDRKYLAGVTVAGANAAGVAPLRREVIAADLARLKRGQKAILMFHWGRDNMWFPPAENVDLAHWLLADERVALIIGSHAHRAQGVVRRHGKAAYMCLGNFLIPNFYLAPKFKLAPPPADRGSIPVTRIFHDVPSVRYFKWHESNRISLIVTYDTESGESQAIPVRQDDDRPRVSELSGPARALFNARMALQNLAWRLPRPLYEPLELGNRMLRDRTSRRHQSTPAGA